MSAAYKVLIANRGEVSIRVERALAELGLGAVAVYSEDDARSLHVRRASEARALSGRGASAYLDIAQLIAAAKESGCAAVHPGYGFLSESARFAQACVDAGLTFIGPRAETLALLGDKLRARALAAELEVPVLPATAGDTSLADAEAFLVAQGGAAIVLKAVAGGGGRGMRVVRAAGELADAHARCRSEAKAAFGDDTIYAERLVERARHVEVQILGDGSGRVTHLWERECTLQRRHQKLLELAPSPTLEPALRESILAAATRMAERVAYLGLGTFEFLIDGGAFYFIEANPRLQVEHTVTEQITGVDLVGAQIEIARGKTLGELGLEQARIPKPQGFALQARVNMETMRADGVALPAGGVLSVYEPPGGPGVRVDGYGYAGYATSPSFDSLLAKLVVHSPSPVFGDVLARARRALAEFSIVGVPTNLGFLEALVAHPDVERNQVTTRFVEEHAAELVAEATRRRPSARPAASSALAGARIDSRDPLAVLEHGKRGSDDAPTLPPPPTALAPDVEAPAGTRAVRAPMQGTIISLDVAPGDTVRAGHALCVMEAMKMEHVIAAEVGGVVHSIPVNAGDAVYQGHAILFIEEDAALEAATEQAQTLDLGRIRPDLKEVLDRHAYGYDERRPDAVEKRRKTGHRTARENIADLIDPGSLVEYGPLAIAAQRRRRSEQELIERTPADGLVTGIARINGALFGEERSQCIVMSYDYTVLAGTQGAQNHRKKDRMFELAERYRLPLVLFAEGGGGRPGDSDGLGVSGLDCLAFAYFGKLSGLVPLVGITTGRCFAGNAALLGCCDVVIATEGSNIGMGGPAMIEGGGLGVFRPEEIGPLDVQVGSGVVDIAVKDEVEAVAVAKKYLGYFQGRVDEFACADQRLLRGIVPENRKRIYDMRAVIEVLCDGDSVLELRRGFGLGMMTVLARIEGRPLGIIANNPGHLAGAIDSAAADKAARFMQLCDAFDLPILFLCDTPGIMVGPEAEKTGLVRHAARMFVNAASLSVPFFTIVVRKGYGLGAQLMGGGSFKAPFFLVGWPTSEFGGMGLEGAVKLGFRKELAAIEDPDKRKETFDKMVALAYDRGKGVNAASHFEFDDVIDPVTSRDWILAGLRLAGKTRDRSHKKRPCIDTW